MNPTQAQLQRIRDLSTQLNAELADLQTTLSLPDTPSPAANGDHILAYPWIGQNTPLSTDDWSNSDCGPACVAMIVSASRRITVDDASKATGLSRGYTYTVPQHLITAAASFGVKLTRMTGLSIDALKNEINAGRPVIVLVHYASLLSRFDQNFRAGHWVLVVGYTDTEIVYHDPYWPSQDGGSRLHIAYAAFGKAMADDAIDGNTPNQALMVQS